jgi:hypothetical protein
MTSGKISILAKLLLPLFLVAGCNSSEPDFSVAGDPDVLDKVQINLLIGRDAREPNARPSTLETLFINGKTKKIDYGKVYSYSIYVKYDNKLFGYYKHENFMHDLDPENAKNEISVFKKGHDVFFNYDISKEEGIGINPIKMLPKNEIVDYVLKENEKRGSRYVDKEAYIENLKRSFDPINF